MHRLFTHRFSVLIFLPLILSACTGINQKPIQKQYYDLYILSTPEKPQNFNIGASLAVREFQITSAFDSHQFIYRIGNEAYINDFYSEFISYPARLITERLARLITMTDRFSTSQDSDFRNIEYRLYGQINKLFGDYREKNNPSAVLEIELTLEKQVNDKFETVLSTIYTAEVPMEARSPAQLAKAWGKALTRISGQFMDAVDTQ